MNNKNNTSGGRGVVSLVYAKNPFEAIDLVDEFRRMRND